MNHTTLASVAVLAAAALVIGAVATPAFAGGYEKRDKYVGDSSATITKQINKQKQVISGDFSEGTQTASNCIAVLNGPNACRTQDNGPE
jgi:outer membrane receptor protein involved in Fe transport